jgi:putative MATE family efflux protein
MTEIPANRAPNYSHGGRGDLTSGPVNRHLVRLTIPMVWAMFAAISFQLVDTFFVSRLGTKPLTAMSFTFPVSFAVFNITLGMSIATSSVVSRQIGRGNPARVRRLVTHALIMAFALGVILAVAGLLLMKPIFRAMGADEELVALICQFMTLWFAGSIFINTPLVCNAAIRATGNTMFPAIVMTIAALVNAALDPPLIFGMFGLPALGIRGAAIATVSSNACAMLAGLYFIGVKKGMLSRNRRKLRLIGDSFRKIVFIALPVGLTGALMPLVSAIITRLLAKFSTDAVAAYGIATRVEAFSFIVIIALATGMAPIIGQNWGARQFERVNKTLHKAFTFACLWSIGTAIVLYIFATPIARLFSNDPKVVNDTVLYFHVIPVTYFLGNLVPGWQSAFNAMGMPKRAFVMIVVRLFVMNLPLALIGAHYYGQTGIFAAIALTNVISGAVYHLLNRRFCLNLEKEMQPASA